MKKKLNNFFKLFKRDKPKSIEVLNKEEIEKEAKSMKVKEDEGEPSFFHYAGVLLVIIGIITVFYVSFEVYENFFGEDLVVEDLKKTYIYPYKLGNTTYNIEFHYPITELVGLNYPLEVTDLDLINSVEIINSFSEYNGTDNGKVTVTASKITSFLKRVYFFSFEADVNFKMINESNCTTSTKRDKVILYNPYSDKDGVFYNESNGCIQVLASSPDNLIKVGDYFIFSLINSK
jgi:hypothetical protein